MNEKLENIFYILNDKGKYKQNVLINYRGFFTQN